MSESEAVCSAGGQCEAGDLEELRQRLMRVLNDEFAGEWGTDHALKSVMNLLADLGWAKRNEDPSQEGRPLAKQYDHVQATIVYVEGIASDILHPSDRRHMKEDFERACESARKYYEATVKEAGRTYVRVMLDKADEVVRNRKAR